MAKATTTIKQSLQYQPQHVAWFATNQNLFNQVAAFYFSVIQAHENVLELGSKEALTALEKLTHTTERNPHPVMPLSEIGEDIPAMFRRAAIHAALGSAHSFYAHLKKWRARKEKALAKGKKFTERPPVPPRTWNKSATLYAGMWKDRTKRSMIIKVGTGTCWSWLKVRLTGRELPAGTQASSPSLVRHGGRWWLHTPVEKRFATPLKLAQQLSNPETKMCAVDLNLDGSIAVCTVQTAEGTILATRLIVHFAQEQGATILVFEHLGKLQPEKGKYSRRVNSKRAFWMKGRIFFYAKYKAWNEGMITSRVNPRNTSRQCTRCHAPIIRYAWGQPEEGYTTGAPLMLCPACGLRGHADRNASGCIGQRLITRYQQNLSQEKPHTPRPRIERGSKDSGVACSQDAEGEAGPSMLPAGHGASNGHGTAHEVGVWMEPTTSPIPHQLRLWSRVGATLQVLRTPTT